jgi:hypothetical protein
MDRAKGDEGNATAKGGAVSSEGRCDPVPDCIAHATKNNDVSSPTRVDAALRVRRATLPGAPFARSLTKQSARKASSRLRLRQNWGRPRRAEQCLPMEDATRSGMRAPKQHIISRSRRPPLPDPASRAPQATLRGTTALHSLAS